MSNARRVSESFDNARWDPDQVILRDPVIAILKNLLSRNDFNVIGQR